MVIAIQQKVTTLQGIKLRVWPAARSTLLGWGNPLADIGMDWVMQDQPHLAG